LRVVDSITSVNCVHKLLCTGKTTNHTGMKNEFIWGVNDPPPRRPPSTRSRNANVTRNNIGIPSTGSESQPARIYWLEGVSAGTYKHGRSHFHNRTTAQPYARFQEGHKRRTTRERKKDIQSKKKIYPPFQTCSRQKGETTKIKKNMLAAP
jgi:hypothetical protein